MDGLFRVLWGWYQPTQLYFTISLASQASFFMICAGDAIGRDYCAHVLRPGVHHVITVMEMKCKQAFLLYILVVWDFALYKYKEKRQKWLLVAAMILLFFFISWNNNCLFDFSWIKMGTGFFFNSRAIYYWPR